MKKINYIKLFLDVIMAIIFVLLFNTHVFGGLTFHEVAGLFIGIAILVHIGLNWRWVKNITLSIFNKKITLKTRIGYFINILLLLDIATIIISGIFISKVTFNGLNIHSSFFNKSTHASASFIALALIGIHVGLHWQWIMNIFKKIVKINKPIKPLNYILKAMSVLVLALGLYNMTSVNYFSKTIRIFNINYSVDKQENRSIKSNEHFQVGDGDTFNNSNKDRNKVERTANENMPNKIGIGSSNILDTLSKYLSIMGVFTVITYLVEKLFYIKNISMN
ncbi:DUF4405 domain-containing protein [Clostridium intestinale]|uniref:DUF4405 domain-containing protein n=1 Tax=Clostridium intestinale TaxID=36845 RepID=UPI002DD649E4|nr:DUF4405 domain-containing protein [Clostridium intestinale]WRY52856.1 DUF4405 domain-containing protein [Clostridium intestinale]